jgi:hypothetical protein
MSQGRPVTPAAQFWYRRLLLKDFELLRTVEKTGGDGDQPSASSVGGALLSVTPPPPGGAEPAAPGGGSAGGGFGPNSHWQKMMNLLMQLRKVGWAWVVKRGVGLPGCHTDALQATMLSSHCGLLYVPRAPGCCAAVPLPLMGTLPHHSCWVASIPRCCATSPHPPPTGPPTDLEARIHSRPCAQVCCHPYLFSVDAEPEFDGASTGEDIVEASGKMAVLDRLLRKLAARGHRVVLFSQFARMLDILEDYIRLRLVCWNERVCLGWWN